MSDTSVGLCIYFPILRCLVLVLISVTFVTCVCVGNGGGMLYFLDPVTLVSYKIYYVSASNFLLIFFGFMNYDADHAREALLNRVVSFVDSDMRRSREASTPSEDEDAPVPAELRTPGAWADRIIFCPLAGADATARSSYLLVRWCVRWFVVFTGKQRASSLEAKSLSASCGTFVHGLCWVLLCAWVAILRFDPSRTADRMDDPPRLITSPVLCNPWS